MFLVITYSTVARQTLRNVCREHDDTVVRHFGRAALFSRTEFGAFCALRLRAKHGDDVQVERTEPLNEFEPAFERVRVAAEAYEDRASPYTPYERFAAGTDYPAPDAMREREL
ncbi:hypothetical protein [Haloarchaeobius sp. HRN-SO-5]|uniref:DUF7855 family protein n=1 Tax=Haloarchaeobius sp. HRN-SO-5 TaxID=3446118 RepID=UPI003EB83AF5